MSRVGEEQSIHDFDYRLICEYFASTDRQGPGSRESTLRALSFLPRLGASARVADIGCGCGSSALVLAAETGACVMAVDVFPQFVERTAVRAVEAGVRIDARVADMARLPFAEGEYDVLWSEGAIYNIGFRHGLELWRPFLKEGGYVVATDAVWLSTSPPAEVESFWRNAYPEIDTVGRKMQHLMEAGYVPVASFVLPSTCWTDEFYRPQREAQHRFLEQHPDSEVAAALVQNQRREAEMYRLHGRHYGYAFFIGRKA